MNEAGGQRIGSATGAITAGIDLGGTKIEAQVFNARWQVLDRRRIATPRDYPGLVAAVTEQIRWLEQSASRAIPVGISAAGLVNPVTGLALTANLAATGKPFPADLAAAAGRGVTYVNDCRALTLSEAVFGAGKGRSPVVGLILGTGIGGGVAVGGRLLAGKAHVGGEFGHFGLAASVVVQYGLPVLRCGCGRMGCTETLIAGPGMGRIAEALIGKPMTPPQISAARHDPGVATVWQAWLALLAEMVMTLCLVIDPECVVLGGGLSQIEGLIDALTLVLRRAQLPGFALPSLLIAEGGDASGARGAAYAALFAAEGSDV